MRRMACPERPDWQARAAEVGFKFHTAEGQRYWDERACYVFSIKQIEDDIEVATEQIAGLCYEAVEHVLGQERLLDRLGIPAALRDWIGRSWSERQRDLYGRMDFRYDGLGPPKLYEFNADTPTGLFEAAVFQWLWLEDMRTVGALPSHADQFNSIQERLIDAFAALAPEMPRLHFACVSGHAEDRGTVAYLEDCAHQGGIATSFLFMDEIGVDARSQFRDLDEMPIEALFKLYPWEWMLREQFATFLPGSGTRFIEPPWKMLLSNKGLLAVLWEMFPGHPNLLETYFADDPAASRLGGNFARKPLFGREGANIRLMTSGGRVVEAPGPYGVEGHVHQALATLPSFEGNYPVIGSWLVAGEPCGMGVREDDGPITRNSARFLPHAIID